MGVVVVRVRGGGGGGEGKRRRWWGGVGGGVKALDGNTNSAYTVYSRALTM